MLDKIKDDLRIATPGDWKRGIGNQACEVSDQRGLLIATFRNPNDGTLAANAPAYLRWCIEEIDRLWLEAALKALPESEREP